MLHLPLFSYINPRSQIIPEQLIPKVFKPSKESQALPKVEVSVFHTNSRPSYPTQNLDPRR